MSWLTPLLGILGVVGLIVLIIIYIIKPNYQNKIISSTFVWKLSLKYKKNKIPLNKLRSILLFLCQVLIIATAALILAQPFIASDKVESQRKVLIIDASVSMLSETGAGNRFEKAVDEASKFFLAWFSSSILSTKNKTLFALPVFKNNFIIPAEVKVLPVPVAISNKNLLFPCFAEF